MNMMLVCFISLLPGISHPFNLKQFAVKKPTSVSYVEAAGCIGDAVKAYTALHYLGRMCSGETGILNL